MVVLPCHLIYAKWIISQFGVICPTFGPAIWGGGACLPGCLRRKALKVSAAGVFWPRGSLSNFRGNLGHSHNGTQIEGGPIFRTNYRRAQP